MIRVRLARWRKTQNRAANVPFADWKKLPAFE